MNFEENELKTQVLKPILIKIFYQTSILLKKESCSSTIRRKAENMTGPIDPPNIPPSDQPPIPSPAAHDKKAPTEFGKTTGKPMNYLGMHFTGPEAAKLWDIIMQQLNTQVRHEQERMLKALRKLRKSEIGQSE